MSGVTRAMLDALTALGVAWQLKDKKLAVCGTGLLGLRAPATVLNCHNSATTLRMLTGAVAAAGIAATLDGSAGLRRRPMKRITEPLRKMGVEIDTLHECAPLRLHARESGRRLSAIDYTLPVASAQVKSCLLLAALDANGPTTIHEPGPSRDHTERILRAMGVRVATEQNTSGVTSTPSVTLYPPSSPMLPFHMTLPGDFSAAAFLIVAALITPGSVVTLHDVGLNPTRTGLLDVLKSMGGEIQTSNLHDAAGEPVGDLTIHHSILRGTTVSGDLVVRMIDEFPVFAVAAAYAEGVTVVRDAAELRLKESDRIDSIAEELHALGVEIEGSEDGFRIVGGGVTGGAATSHGDHRIAMSCAIAGLASKTPVTINEAEIIDESFPGFANALLKLGAQPTGHS